MQGNIINVTRFCTDDGPGIRTTVFLKGCPLKCAWCHNPESQNPKIETYLNGETIGQTVTADEIFKEILKDKVFYETSGGGVTISGGEPLFQSEFTAELLRLCQENHIHTAIETCGFGSVSDLEKVLRYCDLVLFDIKETNAENHIKFTGVPLNPILENLKRINNFKIPFVIRLPIIPTFNDRNDHLLAVEDLAETLSCCHGVEIMPYHRLGEYKYEQLGREYRCKNLAEPSKSRIKEWESLFKNIPLTNKKA